MKKNVIAFLALSTISVYASAQTGKNMVDRIKSRAQSNIENKVEYKTDQAIDKAIDKTFDRIEGLFNKKKTEESTKGSVETQPATGNTTIPATKEGTSPSPWICPDCGKSGNTGMYCIDCGAKRPAAGNTATGNTAAGAVQQQAEQEPQALSLPKGSTASWNRYDFVPGDAIFFEDNIIGERVGEIPSKWNLCKGDFEVSRMDGEEVLCLFDAVIEPLMVDPNDYLTEAFTLEFDYYDPIRWGRSDLSLLLFPSDRTDHSYYWNEPFGFYFSVGQDENTYAQYNGSPKREFRVMYEKVNQSNFTASASTVPNYNGWNHIALSFNKGNVKIYVNQDRVVNGNLAKQMNYFLLYANGSRENPTFIRNVRLAKGAVPLYDRLMTDGRIISYGITFEAGKGAIKPESTGEINRIVKLMQDNPNLSFEVQGHCDSTGSDSINDTLSQMRAEAIVDILVNEGISRNRLTAVGMGSRSPIADNSTEEGRARNRRVEFIKK